MKIVYCIKSLGSGAGMERVLSTKVNYLADVFGIESHIVVMEKLPEDLFFHFSDKIIFHSLEIQPVKMKPWHILFRNKSQKKYESRLALVLKGIKPNITVSMFGPEYDFLYRIKDGSVKVLEFHFTKNYLSHLVNGLPNTKTRWAKKIWVQIIQFRERYYSIKYDHIVLLTERDKELWGGGSRFTVIPNPVSFTSNRKATLESKRIVAMGRYIAQKGFDLLVEAYGLIATDFLDWQVFIYGEGQDKGFLQQQINRLSLQGKIFLKDPVKNVEKELLDASIFVFPSRYEGFGLVLTESMMCGVPCIAFDCECGPSEIIRDNEDGFLVDPLNINDLASKMRELMTTDFLRKKMGELSKENVLRFTEPKIMNLWVDFFSKLR